MTPLGEINLAIIAGWVLVGLRSGVLFNGEHFDTVLQYLLGDLMNAKVKVNERVKKGVELEKARGNADEAQALS